MGAAAICLEMVARGGLEPPTRGFSERYGFDSVVIHQRVTGTSVAQFAEQCRTMQSQFTQNSHTAAIAYIGRILID